MVKGIGFRISISDEGLLAFINNHREALSSFIDGQDAIDYIDEGGKNPKEDLYDCSCDISGAEGIYSLVSNVMTKETGVSFCYYRIKDPAPDSYIHCLDWSDLEDDIVLFVPDYPWRYSDSEKALTEQGIREIVQKYIDELISYGSIGLKVEYIEAEKVDD